MGHCWRLKIQIDFSKLLQKYAYNYSDAKGVCLCFSLANVLSFDNLDYWFEKLDEYEIPREQIILVGCKSDIGEMAKDEILMFAH